MASILHDCPYCGGRSAAFRLNVDTKGPDDDNHWHSMGKCGVCRNVAMFVFKDYYSQGIAPSKGLDVDENDVTASFPLPEKSRIASSIPENVEKSLGEAEDSYRFGLYSAAGSCYRKAMERSLKHLNPDEEGMLNRRIRSLEKSGEIPKSMIELLDQVRLFGNETMHDDDFDPTKEDVSAAREFAHLFLTYAFSMPAQVEAAKQKRSGNAEP